MKFLILSALVAFVYCQGPIGPGVPDSRCPAGTPNPPLHLSDPSDCSRFFTCSNGLAVPFQCPSGQHWSTSSNTCDWPDRANCVSCPAGNPHPPVTLPHPTDCSRFFKCTWGVPVEINCPAGQHWSQRDGWCDWPDRANCVLGSTTTSAPATNGTTTRSTTTRSTTTTSTRATTTTRR